MVRLKAYYLDVVLPKTLKFQFLYGAIKSAIVDIALVPGYNFNSFMVRLKDSILKIIGVLTEFQFLYGAIKRRFAMQSSRRVPISIPLWCD